MNKAAIEKFAVWARTKLISEITYKMGLLGITEKGIAEPLPQSTGDLQVFDIGTKNYAEVTGTAVRQRAALVSEVRQREKTANYGTALHSVIEEVAYTWFNRLIAVRFMEVNDYLPSRIRVLSSENPAKSEPDLVTDPFDTDLVFTPFEQDRIVQLKDENQLDELFRMLFIKQCNQLHDILPELFEKTDDYTELLLTISFADKDGVVYHLTHDIAEDDFNVEKEGQVEIIGWMYQYYISEKHEEVVDPLHGKTIKKEDIPAATQLFTTDWVVRYMVDNSLGRYWIERHPQSKLAEKLPFFVTPKDGNIQYTNEKISPEELTFFDPCMGSGHILVYAFDVLMEIYRECGYSDRDAAISILENNIFGVDIDKRAFQLAYFAVMMKARNYNRRVFSSGVSCHLAAIEESNGIDRFENGDLTADKEQNKIGEYLIDAFRDAKEIGSLQTVEQHEYTTFGAYLDAIGSQNAQLDIFSSDWLQSVKPTMERLCKQAEILSNKYAVVCTNPPYMNKLDRHLKDFVVTYYKAYSGDLFSVFMYRNFGFCKENGYSAFMTPFVWMFIKTYEALRNYIIENKSITTLVQMEYSAFEEATVPICSFVLKNGKATENGLYFKLSDFKGGMDVQKQKVLEALVDKNCGYFYEADQSNFSKIPGSPIAYWVSERLFSIFDAPKLKDISKARRGLETGNNEKFLKLWHEINYKNIDLNCTEISSFSKKWLPHNKGGNYRNWYGNNELVVFFENDGEEIRKSGVLNGYDVYLNEGVTWTALTSGKNSFRYSSSGFTFDSNKGPLIVDNGKNIIKYLLGFFNSNINHVVTKIINPTLSLQNGDMDKLPIIIDGLKKPNVDLTVENNITISKSDWDSFETSWDFKRNPLV